MEATSAALEGLHSRLMAYPWRDVFGWAYTGVDPTLAGNGGEDCINFIPKNQKILETVLFLAFSTFEILFAYPRLKLPEKVPVTPHFNRTSKKVLLLVMALTYGIELGFKFATKQVIFILNPCHVVTMVQLYLLVAPPTKLTMAIFRVQMHCLSGASIALIFPVVNTRLLPFETETYYIQHILMLIIPFYLMRIGGVYSVENLFNFNWAVMAAGLLFFYHWTGMQLLAMATLVNLNNMMCPAISDPFYGRYYRICAVIHQTLVIYSHGKIYTWIASKLLGRKGLNANWEVEQECNGHIKAH